MNKLYKVLTLVTMSMLLIIITVSFDYNNNRDNLTVDLMGMKAVAQEPGKADCTSFGFRNWNHANPLKSAGYDCLCEARNNVANDCE